MNSPILQLLVLAGIAIFLIVRLKSVLGTRDGFEGPPVTRPVEKPVERRGFEVIERAILPDEMAEFEACFLTGTAAEVTPVSEIGPYSFQVDAISRTLMEDYHAEVQPQAAAKVAAAG